MNMPKNQSIFSEKELDFEKIFTKAEIKVIRLNKKFNAIVLKKLCDSLTLLNEVTISKRYSAVKLPDDGTKWGIDPFDRSWRFWLHALTFVEVLIDGFDQFNEDHYLQKAFDFIHDWAEYNFIDSNSEMAWHDHSTALRLIIICKVYEKLKNCDKLSVDKAVFFYKIAYKHCSLLVDSTFYMDKHNHGMDQDVALLVGVTVFDQFSESEEWKKLSIMRFKDQLSHLFMSDGSYAEHSPDYVGQLTSRIVRFSHFINENGLDENNDIEKLLTKVIETLTYFLQPDGNYPAMGDSISKRAILDPLTDELELPSYHYLMSNGIKGVEPESLCKVLELSGYAFLRNKWTFDKETVQAIFFSSFHSKVHKHHDDLSFLLFGHGQPLLVDAGKYNYVYTSKERQYVVSKKAHNSVCVDGENTHLSRLNIGKSGLVSYYFDKDFSCISGFHCLYSGVIHQRILLQVGMMEFIIIDKLTGHKEHQFEQNFHFDSRLECYLIDKEVRGVLEDEEVISITQLLGSEKVKMNLVKGEENPMAGWMSQVDGELNPNYNLASIQNGQDAQFVTQISLNPKNKLNIEVKWEKNLIDISWNDQALQLVLTDYEMYLSLNKMSIEVKQIDHKILKQAILDQKSYLFREKYRSERLKRIKLQEELELATKPVVIEKHKTLKKSANGEIEIRSLEISNPYQVDRSLKCEVEALGNQPLMYAWYIYRNSEKIKYLPYSENNTLIWTPEQVGNYQIKVFVKNTDGVKISHFSSDFEVVDKL